MVPATASNGRSAPRHRSPRLPRVRRAQATDSWPVAYTSVARGGKTDANTLVIEGEVTRFVEGNAALRALVGLGAGSSYFDADVRFLDGANGKVVGTMKADKNSWVLGGGLAAGQTVETFMNGAAKKVGQESMKFSNQGASR